MKKPSVEEIAARNAKCAGLGNFDDLLFQRATLEDSKGKQLNQTLEHGANFQDSYPKLDQINAQLQRMERKYPRASLYIEAEQKSRSEYDDSQFGVACIKILDNGGSLHEALKALRPKRSDYE
jgi:hypothetical protein